MRRRLMYNLAQIRTQAITYSDGTPILKWICLLCLQAGLALAMYFSPPVATAHALAVFGLGLWFLAQDRHPLRLMYLCGYIVGAEVLWRMTDARLFWEFGKYAIGFLLSVGALRWRFRWKGLPILYFAMLLPSAVITARGLNILAVRDAISFNLSGPFMLTVAAIFFANIKMSWSEIKRLLFFMFLPIVGIATLTLYAIQSAEFIYFTDESNFLTSAGYGPNQVSAILGLGALIGWIYFVLEKPRDRFRWMLFAIALWLLIQAILTFSRGGVFNFLICTVLATSYLLQLRYKNLSRMAVATVAFVAVIYAFLPVLDEFTGGMFKVRYTNLETTHRAEIILADIEIGLSHPLLGVGPGEAKKLRAHYIQMAVAAHTEFTRMVAEHGLFGFCALLILFLMFLKNFRSTQAKWARGLILALTVWSLAEMSHAAMRLAAISFVYAIPFARIEERQ